MSDVHLRHNPFSLYDFIGYFIPGAVFLALAALLTAHVEVTLQAKKPGAECSSADRPHSQTAEHQSCECSTEPGEFPPPVEMWKEQLRPTLLEEFRSIEESAIGEGSVAYVNGVLLVVFAYVIGNIISTLSKLTIEKYAIGTLRYPSQFLISDGENEAGTQTFFSRSSTARGFLGRIVLFILVLPISLFDFACWLTGFRRFYAERLSDTDRAIVKRNIPKMLRTYLPRVPPTHLLTGTGVIGAPIPPAGGDDEALRLMEAGDVYPSVVFAYEAKAGSHLSSLENYLALYGFFRNLAGITIVLFWGYAGSLASQLEWIQPVLLGTSLVAAVGVVGLWTGIARKAAPEMVGTGSRDDTAAKRRATGSCNNKSAKEKGAGSPACDIPGPVASASAFAACAFAAVAALRHIDWPWLVGMLACHDGVLVKLVGLTSASIILYLGFVKFYRRQAEEVLLAAAVSEARDQGS